MRDMVRVAVVQASPVNMDAEATTEKACRLIAEAGARGAELVLLPEVLIPGYPRGLSFGTVVGGRTDAGRRAYARYWENSVDAPGPATEALGTAAARAGLYAAVGVSERVSSFRGGTLYNTLLYFGPDGRLLARHRKLKPTAAERLIWGDGDGSTLATVETPFGTVGGLICWENYMPMARMAMYARGVDLYLAPTADHRDSWQATIRHVACEGRCYVLACNQFMTRSVIPAEWEEIGPGPEITCRGGSAIVGPLGDYVAGPLFNEEGMLVADLPLGRIAESRFDFDVVGHYNRPDVFTLVVDEEPHPATVRAEPRFGRAPTEPAVRSAALRTSPRDRNGEAEAPAAETGATTS